MLWAGLFFLVMGLLEWFVREYSKAKQEVDVATRHKKTNYKQVRRLLTERTNIPKSYIDLHLYEGRAGVLAVAEDLWGKVDKTKKPSWTSIVAVAIYSKYWKDCSHYQQGDPVALERLNSLHIADFNIQKTTQEPVEKMIRRLTGFL